jgi:ubiquinone/menaquinone biosynthesis C-methylase UbiE
VTTPSNPYSLPGPWDLVASGYAEVTMKMLGQFAAEAIQRANLKKESRILDVACGPGTLSLMAAGQVQHVCSLDFSAEMLALFRDEIKKGGSSNIDVNQGDGQALPYENNLFDAAFSMFGLMFFPDRQKGFSEIYRTLKKKGRALVTSWAPVDRSPLMQTMFEAIQKMTEETASPTKAMASLEDPAVFRREMEGAGFQHVEILPITKNFSFSSVEQFWGDMVKGSAPIVVLRKKIGELVWKEKEKLALQFLNQKFNGNTISLSSQAWLGVGDK